MELKNNGGAAFPVASAGGSTLNVGMTLRDYFAAQALPAAMEFTKSVERTWPGWAAVAKSAYNIADAMLKERAA